SLTITDAGGHTVFALDGPAGDTVSGGVFLAPGTYTVRFTITNPVARATYLLAGDNLTDPIGPVLDDPTLVPQFTNPNGSGYVYPGGTVSRDPFAWAGLLL